MAQNTLEIYVQKWSEEYKIEFEKIKTLKPQMVKNWNQTQIQSFIFHFYHIRGHFDRILWFLGSTAPNLEYKKIILENIEEEFGGNSVSHEQLFFQICSRV